MNVESAKSNMKTLKWALDMDKGFNQRAKSHIQTTVGESVCGVDDGIPSEKCRFVYAHSHPQGLTVKNPCSKCPYVQEKNGARFSMYPLGNSLEKVPKKYQCGKYVYLIAGIFT
jgi:hypothetical protein